MFIPQKYRYVFVTFMRDVHDYAGRIPLLRERQGGFAVAPLTPSQSPLLQVFCFVAGDFASADATKGLCGRPLESFAVVATPAMCKNILPVSAKWSSSSRVREHDDHLRDLTKMV